MVAEERLSSKKLEKYALEHLHRYLMAGELVAGKTVLDIASGEGYGGNILADYALSVTGVDLDLDTVNRANKKYRKNNLCFIQGDCLSIPLKEDSVDVVTSFETIEHHDQHLQMIQEIKRVLKPSGILIMSTPEKLYYSDIPKSKNPYHIKELYFNEFKDLLSQEFKNLKFLFQRSSFYSIISSEEFCSYKEYGGDFKNQYTSETMFFPVYNLVVCSNTETLPKVGTSCFNGDLILENFESRYWAKHYELIRLKKNFKSISKSKSFQIGRFLTRPFRFLKP